MTIQRKVMTKQKTETNITQPRGIGGSTRVDATRIHTRPPNTCKDGLWFMIFGIFVCTRVTSNWLLAIPDDCWCSQTFVQHYKGTLKPVFSLSVLDFCRKCSVTRWKKTRSLLVDKKDVIVWIFGISCFILYHILMCCSLPSTSCLCLFSSFVPAFCLCGFWCVFSFASLFKFFSLGLHLPAFCCLRFGFWVSTSLKISFCPSILLPLCVLCPFFFIKSEQKAHSKVKKAQPFVVSSDYPQINT